MTQAEKTNDRRRFSRILLDVTVEFEHDNKHWKSEVIDISLKGMLIEKPNGWRGINGDKYVVDIQLDPETSIGMYASVAHINEHSIGFECKVIDITSIAHLRRVVELNLGNTTLLERELHALGNPDK